MTQELRTEDRLRAAAVEFVVITGLSGAGRSEAAKALEDLGYFVIDNLPPSLIGRVAELAGRPRPDLGGAGHGRQGGAFTADVSELTTALDQLRAQDVNLRVVFLEASDEVLIRRFEATRRRHPVAGERVAESIALERDLLRELRADADLVLDTSDLNVHELRAKILAAFADEAAGLLVTVTSFGFKYGLPLDADMVVDVRFLPNPHCARTARSPALTRRCATMCSPRTAPACSWPGWRRCWRRPCPAEGPGGQALPDRGHRLHRRQAPQRGPGHRAGRLADRQGLPGPRRPPGRGARVRVAALGGGHGLAAPHRPAAARGGATCDRDRCRRRRFLGVLRRDLGPFLPGDLRKAMLALVDPTAEVRELFGYRFERGDLAGQPGQPWLRPPSPTQAGGSEALEEASRWLRVHGNLPATLVAVRLCGRSTGCAVEGQVAIATASGRVESVWLEPGRPAAVPAAVRAVRQADLVLLGPGSTFTSVVPNLLVPELADALTDASRLVYICNLEAQPGETTGFPPEGHLAAILDHCPACRWRPPGPLTPTPPAPPGSCGPSPSPGRRSSTPRWPPTTTLAATTPPAWPPPSRS